MRSVYVTCVLGCPRRLETGTLPVPVLTEVAQCTMHRRKYLEHPFERLVGRDESAVDVESDNFLRDHHAFPVKPALHVSDGGEIFAGRRQCPVALMKPLKGLLTVEVDRWVGTRACPKCGGQNRIVHGYVLRDGHRIARYFAELPERNPGHQNPRVALAVQVREHKGSVTRRDRFVALQALPSKLSNSDRVFLRMVEKDRPQIQLGGRPVRLKVVDSQDSPWAWGNVVPGEIMTRAEVIADSDRARFFIAADMAARYDPRIRGYLAHAKPSIVWPETGAEGLK